MVHIVSNLFQVVNIVVVAEDTKGRADYRIIPQKFVYGYDSVVIGTVQGDLQIYWLGDRRRSDRNAVQDQRSVRVYH